MIPSLARTIGRAMAGYLEVVGRHTRIAGGEAARERMDALQGSDRRVVLGYWTEDILPLLLVAWRIDLRLGPPGRDIEFLCDDSLGGGVTAEVVERFGRRARVIHAKHSAARIRDMQAIMRSSLPLGMAVDGTGPWGTVLPTLPRLIRQCRAVVVPIVAVGHVFHVRARARLAVPRPRGRLACVVGEPLDFERERADADRTLAAALESIRRTARSIFESGGPPPARLLMATQ